MKRKIPQSKSLHQWGEKRLDSMKQVTKAIFLNLYLFHKHDYKTPVTNITFFTIQAGSQIFKPLKRIQQKQNTRIIYIKIYKTEIKSQISVIN